MQLFYSFDLPNYVIFSQKLEEPIISFFLYDFDFANILHIWVYTDPKDWVVVQNISLENVFSLCWEIF